MTALLDTLLLCAVDSADGSERQRATNGRYVRDCRTTERWHESPASAVAERRQQTVESHESSIESVQLSNDRQQRQQDGYRVFTRPRKTNVASLRYYVIRSWFIHVWNVACVSLYAYFVCPSEYSYILFRERRPACVWKKIWTQWRKYFAASRKMAPLMGGATGGVPCTFAACAPQGVQVQRNSHSTAALGNY